MGHQRDATHRGAAAWGYLHGSTIHCNEAREKKKGQIGVLRGTGDLAMGRTLFSQRVPERCRITSMGSISWQEGARPGCTWSYRSHWLSDVTM